MVDLAVISGSGFYDFPDLKGGGDLRVKTKYGDVTVRKGTLEGRELIFLSRHGKAHALLPNMINYRANLSALKTLRTKAIISTTVCGVLQPSLPLAQLVVFNDLFFLENRLPGGEICTIYDEVNQKGRGHYIFHNPFSEELRQQIIRSSDNPITDAVYAHVSGPRFNSRAEIRLLRDYATFLSQTAGPEIILAGELEIPIALIGYGVDYANGVAEEPTPPEVLQKNLNESRHVFISVLKNLVKIYKTPKFEGFLYRF